MGLFRRKKKEDVHKDDFMMASGMYLGKADIKNGHIVLNCFLRALIVFFLVLGTIGGFLSAFDIPCNYLIVISVFLILSMYFSFLYATTRFIYRDLGYILFFGLFIVMIFVFRIYANSGFYYVVNKVLDRAKTFFDLPGVREYEVQIGNNVLTVSIAACFIGMVMIIVLNIWMYSIMSVFWTLLFTFPVMFIPLYMKMSPDPIYMVFLTIGYFCVFVFRANGHYVLFAWDSKFKVKGIRKKRVTYTQDAGVFWQLILSLSALFLVTVFVTSAVVIPTEFERRFKSDRLRSKTSDTIGNFLLLGFSSFFDKYPNTAGMSGGKLGGVSNVRPDYLTDLNVVFVPYGNDAIYLRGFVGGEYGDNEWTDAFGYENEPDFESEFNKYSLGQEKDLLKNDNGKYHAKAYMEIRNVGAATEYLYYPYYTEFDAETKKNIEGEEETLFRNGSTKKYEYYPKVVWEEELGALTPDKIDKSNVSGVYLEVPDKNKEVIDEMCKKIGLDASMTEYEIVDKVRTFFAENYPYTLKPGVTPEGSDFVNYFLTKNKKGYCAHFASSSVLIFREMGIPARYVEGYAFSMEEVFTSDEAEGLEASDYYSGYSALGDAPVMNVEVSDANAHAWVEIYVDGFGWKTVEMTPGSNEETEEDDFWSAFGAFMQGGADDDGGFNMNGLNLSLSSLSGIVFVIIGLILLVVLIYIVRIIIRKIRRYMLMHQTNKRDALIARYSYVCDLLRVCNDDFDKYRSHRDQLTFMKETYDVDMDIDEVTELIERMSFHDDMSDEETFNRISQLMHVIKKNIKKKSSLKNRVKMIQK